MVGCVGVFVMEKRLVTHPISRVSWLSSINDYEYEETSNQEGYLWPSKQFPTNSAIGDIVKPKIIM
jgi:hypothetical protein